MEHRPLASAPSLECFRGWLRLGGLQTGMCLSPKARCSLQLAAARIRAKPPALKARFIPESFRSILGPMPQSCLSRAFSAHSRSGHSP